MKTKKSQNMAITVNTKHEQTTGNVMENTILGFILLGGGAVATLISDYIFIGAMVIGGIILIKGILAK